jgi:hypothetical protein
MRVGRLARVTAGTISNPAQASTARSGPPVWPLAFIMFALTLSMFPAVAVAAEWSKPERIATQLPLEDPARLKGVSCPADNFCAAADSFGNVVTTTEPMNGAAAWTLASAKETDSSNGFSGISCPASSFCAAVDIAGGVSSSTNPTGGPATWSLHYIPNSFALSGISCPSASLCLALNGGELAISTDPAAGNWTPLLLSETEGINAVSCSSASFCAAVASGGKVYTTGNPTGGAAAWTPASISGSELSYVSCASTNLCVAGSDFGTLYSSTDPAGGAGTWTGVSVGLHTVSCPTTSLCVGARNNEVVTSTNPTGTAGEWTAAAVDTGPGFGISSVSCTATPHCVAVREGKVITSTNPAGGAAAWSVATVDNAGSSVIQDLSCPSTGFCAAIDTKRHIITSTNPINEAAAWTSFHLEPADFFTASFSALSCPSAGLCVATSGKEVASSTNPTGGAGGWNTEIVDPSSGLSDLACPSINLCVAVDIHGDVLTSTNPSGGAGAWTSATINATTEFRAVTCASVSLCLAVDDEGNIWHSTSPAGGAGAWSSVAVSPGTEFNDISCATGLCVAIASYPSFDLAATSNPTGGAAAWTAYPLESIGGRHVSCPSTNLCLAGGYYNGDYVAASANPLGGASTWAATTPNPEFNGDHYITAATCISDTLCLIGDKMGRVAFGTPKTGGEEEGGETEEHEELTGPVNTCSTDPALCPPSGQGNTEGIETAQNPKSKQGTSVAGSVASVRGNFALLPSRCVGQARCKGLAKLVVKLDGRNAKRHSKRAAHAARHDRKGKALLVVGRGRFNIAPGKRGVIRIKLTGAGKQAIHKAGKRGLRARLLGTGLKARTVTLRQAKGQ